MERLFDAGTRYAEGSLVDRRYRAPGGKQVEVHAFGPAAVRLLEVAGRVLEDDYGTELPEVSPPWIDVPETRRYALLAIGVVYATHHRFDEARDALRDVVDGHPGSAEAEVARSWLAWTWQVEGVEAPP